MNQSFSFSRWRLLVGKHWAEHRRIYGLALVAIAALILLWFILVLYMEPYRPLGIDQQAITYFVGLALVGCIFGSMLFTDLGSKSKAQNYLSLPASHLEKLLCQLLFGVVVLFVCYTLVYYLVDIIMLKVSNAIAYTHWLKVRDGAAAQQESLVNVFVMPDRGPGVPNVFYFILLGYFALQAAFILGSVYFARFSFIKTVITLLVVGLFIAFFIMKFLHYLLPYGDFHHGLLSYRVYDVKDLGGGHISYSESVSDKIIELPEWIGDVLMFLIKYTLAPLFWLVTYFRLKEKEI